MAVRPATQGFMTPQVSNYFIAGLIFITGVSMALVLAIGSVGVGSLVAFLPAVVGLVVLIFNNPFIGILFYINYSYFFIGLNRYIIGAPLGLTVDGVLFLTTLSIVFKLTKDNIRHLNNGIFYTTILWFLYTLFQAFNPEAPKFQAWAYAVRGISFYAIQTIPLALILFTKKENLNAFFNILMGWGIVSSLWGMKQIYIGVDAYEKGWLDREGKTTHILGNQLRAFSFFSDASQFGVTMSYTALIYLVLSFGPYSRKKKILYALGAMLCLVGMGSSGSRGPVFVVFVGILCYLFLARNYRILIPGMGAILIVFAFLKFTYIGNTNYQIYRIRTAIDPKEASLLVRLANQAKLKTYLIGKPFGAGIGTTDVWARRYYPGSYLASLPTDSWFVKIWAENGVVGLSIYALTLAWVIVMGVVNIRKLQNRDTRQKIIALYGGFLGILAASFGNPVFGQAPLGALMYISMAILSTATLFDEPETALSPI